MERETERKYSVAVDADSASVCLHIGVEFSPFYNEMDMFKCIVINMNRKSE